jgi:hypothetical protein
MRTTCHQVPYEGVESPQRKGSRPGWVYNGAQSPQLRTAPTEVSLSRAFHHMPQTASG